MSVASKFVGIVPDDFVRDVDLSTVQPLGAAGDLFDCGPVDRDHLSSASFAVLVPKADISAIVYETVETPGTLKIVTRKDGSGISLKNCRFPEAWDDPRCFGGKPSLVKQYDDLVILSDSFCLPYPCEIDMWEKTGAIPCFEYGSSSPGGITMWDGFHLSPWAHSYVDYLPGISNTRGYEPLSAFVVWTYTHAGRRFVYFQRNAPETDPSFVNGARVSTKALGSAVLFHVGMINHPKDVGRIGQPSTTWTYTPGPYCTVVFHGRFVPTFMAIDMFDVPVFLYRTPTGPHYITDHVSGITLQHNGAPYRDDPMGMKGTFEIPVKIVPHLNGYYSVYQVLQCLIFTVSSWKVECLYTSKGKIPEHLVIVGGSGFTTRPSLEGKLVFEINYVSEDGNLFVVPHEQLRRFSAGLTTTNPRGSGRDYKILKNLISPTIHHRFYARGVDLKPPTLVLPPWPVKKTFYQHSPFEEKIFLDWWGTSGQHYFVVVGIEYAAVKDDMETYQLRGDVLLQAKSSNDFYVCEIKQKGVNKPTQQAYRLALHLVSLLVKIARTNKVYPMIITEQGASIYPAVTSETVGKSISSAEFGVAVAID